MTLHDGIEILKILVDLLKAAIWPYLVWRVVKLIAPDLPKIMGRILKMKFGVSGVDLEFKEAVEQMALAETTSPETTVALPEAVPNAQVPTVEEAVTEFEEIGKPPEPIDVGDVPELRWTAFAENYDRTLSLLRASLGQLDDRAEEMATAELFLHCHKTDLLMDDELTAVKALFRARYEEQGHVSKDTYARSVWLYLQLKSRLPRRVRIVLKLRESRGEPLIQRPRSTPKMPKGPSISPERFG